MLNQLRLAWAYRYFILSSIRNDLFTRFTRSKLGSVWALVNPLVMVAIYAVVLSAVLSAKLPGIDNPYAYAIYLTSGTMGWTLFSEVLTRCLGLFTGNADLIKKMSFPKITLPLIVLGSSLVNSVFLFAAILVIFAFLGHFPGPEILWVPVLQIVTALMAIGVGIIVGVLNVFLRDIEQVVPILLQLLFWFTPIVYPASVVPAALRPWMNLNPVYPLISGYHDVLTFQRSPDPTALAVTVVGALVLMAVGLFLVLRASPEMADVL